MAFNSDTARAAGMKSRRGKGKYAGEMREKITALTDNLIDSINIEDLNTNQRLALLKLLHAHTLPKQQPLAAIETKLFDVEIVKLNKDFEYLNTTSAKKVNIRDNLWKIEEAIIVNADNTRTIEKKTELNTNFNFEKINNLYSDLSSITLWGLVKLKEDYETVNYSTTEINYQFQKILSYPVYLTIMSLLSIVMMMNLNAGTNRIFVITIGIFLSVLIYYINHFFGIIGRNETMPLSVSIWIPLLILLIISTIGLIRINEK